MRGREAITVVDLGYGDAGKGTWIDALAARHGSDLVVRFNGGAQAGHNVVTPDGRHHTFSQLGAATLLPGVRTLLSRFVAIHPFGLRAEAEHLAAIGAPDALGRLLVDRRALVTTPWHQAANRLRERLRGAARHGSCGVGHGETVRDALANPDLAVRVGDLDDVAALERKLRRVQEARREEFRPRWREVMALADAGDEHEWLADATAPEWVAEEMVDIARAFESVGPEEAAAAILRARGPVLLEGAQGVLIDEWVGFHPHTTWSTTTFAQADAVLDEAGFDGDRRRLGVLRTYAVRHGPGPMVSEGALPSSPQEPHNPDHPWQGAFRVGAFDVVATRYAIDACGGADGLLLTHLDRLSWQPTWPVCEAYDTPEGRVDALEAPATPDLDRQAALTARLLASRPVVRRWDTPDPLVFARAASEELGLSLAGVSDGPSRDAKRLP